MAEFPRYKIIGNRFMQKGSQKHYSGPIVACEEGLFFFVDNVTGAAGGDLRILNMAIGAIIDLFDKKKLELRTFDYSKFPTEIKNHPDWPLKKRDSGTVIVLRRDQIDFVVQDYFGTYDIVCQSAVLHVELKLFGRKKVLKTLESMRWNEKEIPELKRTFLSQFIILILPAIGFLIGAIVGLVVGWSDGIGWSPIFYGAIGVFAGLLIGGIVHGLLSWMISNDFAYHQAQIIEKTETKNHE